MTLLRRSVILFPLMLSGCETTDRTLSTADRMLNSTTGQTVVGIAQGKDPKRLLKERATF